MLKKNKKRSNLSKILNKKFTNVQELHEKLKELNIFYEFYNTKMKETYYLLRENNINYACKLCKIDRNCVFLTR